MMPHKTIDYFSDTCMQNMHQRLNQGLFLCTASNLMWYLMKDLKNY